MPAYFSILAWQVPCTEEPGGLQSVGLQRVGHDLVAGHVCKTGSDNKTITSIIFGSGPGTRGASVNAIITCKHKVNSSPSTGILSDSDRD